MRRVAAFAVAVTASWLVLLLWAADVRWGAPVAPQSTFAIAGSDFGAVFGEADVRDGRLHVGDAAEDHSALQAARLTNVAADDFPVLRYRFADFPRTLELALVFRTAEDSDDVQTIALPWPGEGAATFDLSRTKKWHGTIIELGFSEFATAQSVPPELGFKPFDLVDAELWSPSWQGDLAALGTDWFGAWPWSQRSVNALGRDMDSPRAHGMVVPVALAAAAVILWALLLLPRDFRGGVAAAALILAWLVLDLSWQDGLAQRLEATRGLYEDTPGSASERIVADTDLVEVADEIRSMLVNEGTPPRMLVMADTGYQQLRVIWHLLPMNAAPLMTALATGEGLPDGCLVVFVDSDAWGSDPTLRRWLANSQRITSPYLDAIHANGLEGSRIVLYRYRHAR